MNALSIFHIRLLFTPGSQPYSHVIPESLTPLFYHSPTIKLEPDPPEDKDENRGWDRDGPVYPGSRSHDV